MNGHVYWKDKYTLRNPLPSDAAPQAVPEDIVSIICQYFNAMYGEGEMRFFYVLQGKTKDAGWAYYEVTVMEIFEEYFTRIEPDLASIDGES